MSATVTTGSPTVPGGAAYSALASIAATATAPPEGMDPRLFYFGFIPNHDSNLAGLIIFAVLWAAQICLGLWYRQWWWLVTSFIACGLETAGYAGRFLGSLADQVNNDDFLLQIVCLILAPAFLTGGMYYQLAKLVTIFGHQFSPLKPMHYSALFISCDLFSIVLQAIGGGMAAGNNGGSKTGSNIMLAGIVFQVVSMLAFITIFGWFTWRVWKANKVFGDGSFNPQFANLRNRPVVWWFLIALWVATTFVFVRCCYRVAELAEGWNGYLMNTERYFLVLDGLMVFFATFSLTAIHPGFAFGRGVIAVDGLHTKKYLARNNRTKEGLLMAPSA